MKLSPAEHELIEMIRSGEAFAIMLMRKEAHGEMAVSTSVPPFGAGEMLCAIEMTFEEGWLARKLAADLVALVF